MANEIVENEIWVLKTIEKNKGEIRIRIVQWNEYPPQLEKRNYFEKDGELRTEKVKGLTADDLRFLYENHDQIIQAIETGEAPGGEGMPF